MSEFQSINPMHLRSGHNRMVGGEVAIGALAGAVLALVILNAGEQVVLSVKVPADAVVLMDGKELSPCRLARKCDKQKERAKPRTYKWRSNQNTEHTVGVRLKGEVYEQLLEVDEVGIDIEFAEDGSIVVP